MNKKIKVILCISDTSVFEKRLRNSNMEILNKYFILEFWDIRSLSKIWKKKHSDFRFEEDPQYKVHYYMSFQDLKRDILNIKNSNDQVAFLFTGSVQFWNLKVLRFIEKTGLPYFIKRNTSGFIDKNLASGLINNNIKSFQKKVINFIYKKIVTAKIFLTRLNGPTKFFAGVNKELEFLNFPVKEENVVFTHSKDYDNYLQTLNEPKIITDNYFVFIDQNFPFHRETRQLNIDPEIFYSRIYSFLSNISLKTGKKFVIALHPTADINTLSKYFPEDILFLRKTITLVKHADFSVTLNSTTSLTSIITGSPVILLDFEGLLPTQFEPYTRKLEEILNIKALKYNEDLTKEKLFGLLNEGRLNSKKLFEKYIKHPGTTEKLEFEIIAENIINYFNKKSLN